MQVLLKLGFRGHSWHSDAADKPSAGTEKRVGLPRLLVEHFSIFFLPLWTSFPPFLSSLQLQHASTTPTSELCETLSFSGGLGSG